MMPNLENLRKLLLIEHRNYYCGMTTRVFKFKVEKNTIEKEIKLNE